MGCHHSVNDVGFVECSRERYWHTRWAPRHVRAAAESLSDFPEIRPAILGAGGRVGQWSEVQIRDG